MASHPCLSFGFISDYDSVPSLSLKKCPGVYASYLMTLCVFCILP
uniref:Uncharacterized protein n=1 Tax=Anguilla anguilla TaxID=7936 RepID=A0A0E9PIK0_ANGAN